MKLIIPAPFVPVNIFQIYGICCCVTMKNNINDHNFTKRFFCYCAPNIYEANMIVMWGYFSPKLARLLLHYCAFLPAKRFIVHMNNCGDLPHNFQDLNIDINATLECGTQDKATIRHLIKEARQCLQA